MGETTKCEHCDEPLTTFLHQPRHCISALRARLSAAERERDVFRERLLGRANEEPPSGWLRPGEDGYENTPEGARQARDAAIRDRDAAFARGVEAAAKVAHAWGMACSRAPLPETLESGLSVVAAFDVERRIRALAPATDAGKETT